MNHALIFNVNNSSSFDRRNAGGHRIASFLREKEWNVEVFDWGDFFTLEELKEIGRSRITNKTIFVGFSSFMSHWSPNLENFSLWLKQKYPDLKIVLGGQSSPKMASKAIDYYVHGYGEFAILELVKSFVGNHSVKFDPIYKDRKVINAIHSYPAFPLKSLKVDYEKRDFIHSDEWLNVEFSRGCIFKCLYCNYPILGVKGDYTRDPEDFYIEMQTNYDKWGVTNYFVADETFNDYSQKVRKYADVAEKLSFKPWFSAFLRADLLALRPQDWEHMIRLGMLGHFYGIESFNPDTLKAIGKGANIEKVLSGLLDAKSYFKSNGDCLYRGHIALIVGLPFETIESLEKTFTWIRDNWQGEYCHPFPLEIPYDPTADRLSRLSHEYEKWGYKEIESIDFNGVDQVSRKLNWQNDVMNLTQAISICDAWSKFMLTKDFAPTCFDLYKYTILGKDIKEVLNLKIRDLEYLNHNEIFQARLERYKHNKLSS
jgi:hypothetical protein